MLTGKYREFFRRIKTTIAADRLVIDPLRTIAYGTDASFYRLIPKIVINVENELEVQRILREAGRLELPVTFRPPAPACPARRSRIPSWCAWAGAGPTSGSLTRPTGSACSRA